MLFLPILCNCWCLLVISATFKSKTNKFFFFQSKNIYKKNQTIQKIQKIIGSKKSESKFIKKNSKNPRHLKKIP